MELWKYWSCGSTGWFREFVDYSLENWNSMESFCYCNKQMNLQLKA